MAVSVFVFLQHKENYKKFYAIAPIDQYILLSVQTMAIQVVEFQGQGYKIRKVFA